MSAFLRILACSILLSDVAISQDTLTGIDVLVRDNFEQLRNQRVGLITNHTGRTHDGVSTVKVLNEAKSVSLRALFSPEHGFEGKLDISNVANATDSETGLTIFSLYGATRRPTAEMLQEVDTIVFDIQDIGTRFYTYISTMGEAMTAAAEHGKRFVVLDRPNPINGIDIAGPMLDAGSESFVGYHNIPVRHGMTIGELALMFRSERKLDLDLEVIRCEGWKRHQFWDATGLTWINPSPNMRCLTQALLYPGIGLMETTNVSVGRGTDTPFEIIGAPWMNGQALAAALNAKNIPGVTFVPVEFVPDSSKFSGETCSGINIIITNRDTFDPLRTGFQMAVATRKLFRDNWKAESWLRLLGNEKTLAALLAGSDGDTVLKSAFIGVAEFKTRHKAFLLY